MAWKKVNLTTWYNPEIGTEINIKQMSNGYAVRYFNRPTGSSNQTYSTGRTFKEAFEEAEKFMKENP